MAWSLQDIKNKIRNVTGSPSTDQLSDSDLTNYINNYYVYTMPFELKEQIQLEFYDFKVFPGVNVYPFSGSFLTDQPGAYADGFGLIFYQDPDVFFQDFPMQYALDNLATGNGSQVTFVGGLQNPPIIIGTAFFTDGSQVLQDQGNGALTGNGTGTINYITGAFSITFDAAPPSSATIYAKYEGYQPNRPQGVLFFNNQFTFMPVPDQVYQIRMQGYIMPDLLNTDPSQGPVVNNPTLQEWGPLIAYGASMDIFADRGDLDNYNRYYPLLKRYENVALARTIQQYQAEQSVERW